MAFASSTGLFILQKGYTIIWPLFSENLTAFVAA